MQSLQEIPDIYHFDSNKTSTTAFYMMGLNIYTTIVCPSSIMCVKFKGKSTPGTNVFW